MDPRRFLILACAGLTLSGCAMFRPQGAGPSVASAGEITAPVTPTPGSFTPAAARADDIGPETPPVADAEADAGHAPLASTGPRPLADPAPAPPITLSSETADEEVEVFGAGLRPYVTTAGGPPADRAPSSGRRAIVAANSEARAPSRSDAFVGGVQVFAWSPGRVFEVWTAPLRVTTLTLGEGETLVSKAAGDTLRWQIGETTSGSGADQRTHVLLKPLERGLETNLVLTTTRRVYFLELRSGSADGFNAAVAWDVTPLNAADTLSHEDTVGESPGATQEASRIADPVVTPQGVLDARYRIEPQGRRPRWTPTAVFNDGARTFVAFADDLQVDEAPALFVIAPDGEAQLVNYRQSGGLFVVDRVFDRAELRLGDRRPQIVRLQRLEGVSR